MKLLCRIEAEEIGDALVGEIRRLISNRKFRNHLVEQRYLIAIDGTQKLTCNYCWSEKCLQRRVGEDYQYYACVLEANLVLGNGVIIPLLSEFLEYTGKETEESKQDCEPKAFYRLARRLKAYFPHLSISWTGSMPTVRSSPCAAGTNGTLHDRSERRQSALGLG